MKNKQIEYIGNLLEDGHLSIPKEVIDRLKINRKSKIHITLEIEEKSKKIISYLKKNNILSYAGLLSDLTPEEEKQFNDSIKRRNLWGRRKIEI